MSTAAFAVMTVEVVRRRQRPGRNPPWLHRVGRRRSARWSRRRRANRPQSRPRRRRPNLRDIGSSSWFGVFGSWSPLCAKGSKRRPRRVDQLPGHSIFPKTFNLSVCSIALTGRRQALRTPNERLRISGYRDGITPISHGLGAAPGNNVVISSVCPACTNAPEGGQEPNMPLLFGTCPSSSSGRRPASTSLRSTSRQQTRATTRAGPARLDRRNEPAHSPPRFEGEPADRRTCSTRCRRRGCEHIADAANSPAPRSAGPTRGFALDAAGKGCNTGGNAGPARGPGPVQKSGRERP